MNTQQNSAPVYPITGGRKLSEAEIALMNKIKAHGAALEELISEVREFQCEEVRNFDVKNSTTAMREEHSRVVIEGQKWRMRAIDDLQDGMQKLVRSIARPTSFA